MDNKNCDTLSWKYKLDRYNISKLETFKTYVALQSASKLPEYGILSSRSTKGKFACPYYHYCH